MIINEWQLDSQLNKALQHTQHADFALYLALLSPAVEESAAFFTPDATADVNHSNVYQQLGITQTRGFAMTESDTTILTLHSQSLQTGGLPQLKLMASLKAAPLVLHDDKTRIGGDVWQNCSLHCRRRILQHTPVKPNADPVALYDVLEQIHSTAA